MIRDAIRTPDEFAPAIPAASTLARTASSLARYAKQRIGSIDARAASVREFVVEHRVELVEFRLVKESQVRRIVKSRSFRILTRHTATSTMNLHRTLVATRWLALQDRIPVEPANHSAIPGLPPTVGSDRKSDRVEPVSDCGGVFRPPQALRTFLEDGFLRQILNPIVVALSPLRYDVPHDRPSGRLAELLETVHRLLLDSQRRALVVPNVFAACVKRVLLPGRLDGVNAILQAHRSRAMIHAQPQQPGGFASADQPAEVIDDHQVKFAGPVSRLDSFELRPVECLSLGLRGDDIKLHRPIEHFRNGFPSIVLLISNARFFLPGAAGNTTDN